MRPGKEKKMTLQQNHDIYQEYAQSMQNNSFQPTDEFADTDIGKLFETASQTQSDFLKRFQQHYEQKFIQTALNDAKHKKEWQELEADDIRMRTDGKIKQRDAFELLDRYENKIQQCYKTEQWFLEQMEICDQKILELQNSNLPPQRKHNKITHWRERKTVYDINYFLQIRKTHRIERLVRKWRSISLAIETADIKKTIAEERSGHGNKYGFNPNMQSRETATDVYSD